MRIIGLIKTDNDAAKGVPPTKELLENMGRFIEEVANAGVSFSADWVQPVGEGSRTNWFEL